MVVLEGPLAMRSFVDGPLRQEGGPPSVTRLYVSTTGKPSSVLGVASSASVHPSASFAKLSGSSFAELLDEILRGLAPTLEQLAIVASLHDPVEFVLVPMTLPRLTDLTLHPSITSHTHIMRFMGGGNFDELRASQIKRLPALRRLHLLGEPSNVHAMSIPPHLTHLRMANTRKIENVLHFMHVPWTRAVLGDALRHIIFHAERPADPESRAQDIARFGELLAKDGGYTEYTAIVFNSGRPYVGEQILADWLDRARGRPGCWQLDHGAVQKPVRPIENSTRAQPECLVLS
jgi:hypothetical protein